MSLLLVVVSALHILILILLFVATLDKVSLLGAARHTPPLRTPASFPLPLPLMLPPFPFPFPLSC